MVISENLPRRTGLPADAGLGKGFEWTPGGRGQGAGRQERSACFTTGLSGYGQGCCLRVVVLQHQKLGQKRTKLERSFREGFDFWCQGKVFWRVLVGSRRSPACFLQGLAPPVVRWEVSYEGKSFQKKLEF